jgi:hypothetical protein
MRTMHTAAVPFYDRYLTDLVPVTVLKLMLTRIIYYNSTKYENLTK